MKQVPSARNDTWKVVRLNLDLLEIIVCGSHCLNNLGGRYEVYCQIPPCLLPFSPFTICVSFIFML